MGRGLGGRQRPGRYGLVWRFDSDEWPSASNRFHLQNIKLSPRTQSAADHLGRFYGKQAGYDDLA